VFTHTERMNSGIPYTVYILLYGEESRLGGVVVSVLATGPKVCGFQLGQGDGFLRTIKIRSTHSFRMGSKAGRSHFVRFYGM
jgi:hypothetical protein